MSICILFLPWILQGALSSYSLPLTLAISLIISTYSLIKSRYVLEWVTFLFFLISFIVSLFNQKEFVHIGVSLLSSITLSLVAWISLLLRKPFTLRYARERTPSHQWSSKVFFKINVAMTMLFGIIFSCEGLLKILNLLFPALLPYTWLSYLSLGCILLLISRFPNWYKKRLINAQ